MKSPLLNATMAALAALALSAPMTASAATQLIHFDDASNGWKWYSTSDRNFLFDPTNFDSATLCADSTNGGNGNCLLEAGQGELPLMTRPETGTTLPGSASPQDQPDASGKLAFTLDSFYFLLNGNGQTSDDSITAEGSNGNTFTFLLGNTYNGPLATTPVVTLYEGGGAAGALAKQTGYIATFGDLFKDVTWIQFSSAKDANARLDCVVATFNGTTTEPLSNFNNGCGTETSFFVPEPASLALLGTGLLSLAFGRRRRKS